MLTPDAGPTEHGAAATTSPTALWQAMRAYLASLALPVPDLVQASPDGALLLIDDLGDERLFDRVTRSPSERLSLYERAVDLLATFQRQTSATPPPFHVPIFSREHLLAELAEFADMALEHRHAITLSPAERAVLTAAGDTLAAHLIPELLAHRDFQSHNLMLRGDRLVLIDFQDAFWAPRVYDLVALLRDSYVRLPPDELDLLLARYAAHSGLSRDAVTDAFHLQTIQRKLKDSGRFVTLARRGKSQFLAFFADSIAYVITALTRSGRFPALLDLLLTHIPEARAALAPSPPSGP
jgi:aminoglycoside/choline kinase family phosphotransferase